MQLTSLQPHNLFEECAPHLPNASTCRVDIRRQFNTVNDGAQDLNQKDG
jgi:hypothetical protein